METTFIYGLKDPITDEIRYIGKSNNPKSRYSRHISNSKNPKTKCYCWIKGLIDKNLKPVLVILEEVSISEWGQKEDYWISKFNNLTNLIDGGKFCPMSIPSIAKKVAIKNTGRKMSESEKMFLSKRIKEQWDSGNRKGGWNHTEEFKKNKKESTENMWRNRTEDEIKKIGTLISKAKSKPIIQFDINYNIVKKWESAQLAELEFSPKTRGRISRSIKNGKIFKGFYWEYDNKLKNKKIKK